MSTNNSSNFINLSLPPTTIIPKNEDLFVPYFNRTYEDIAQVVNNKDDKFFTMSITSTAQNIQLVPNFGAFIICVSGTDAEKDSTGSILGFPPTITASLCKSDSTAAGSIATLGSQVGTGSWAANTLIISSSSSNFQIRHDRAGVTFNFNIKLIGTQN